MRRVLREIENDMGQKSSNFWKYCSETGEKQAAFCGFRMHAEKESFVKNDHYISMKNML